MKKKLTIALTLALIALLSFGTIALAKDPIWDNEDPCVADNEDFIGGWGYDGGSPGAYISGAQEPWYPGRPPNEGYSLYRDDVTDTGNLDIAAILTFTPDAVDLPIYPPLGGYPNEPLPGLTFWKMVEISPDTWYWALAPRGYNDPPEPEVESYEGGQFVVTMFNSGNKDFTSWANGWDNPDRVLGDDVSYEVTKNGYTLFLEIPRGTHMSFPTRPGTLVTSLNLKVVDGVVKFTPTSVDFSEECTLTVTCPDGEVETITFTQIRGGSPRPPNPYEQGSDLFSNQD